MLWSCHHSPAPAFSPSVLPIEQVVAQPQKYAHKLVTIHGCYLSGFERSTVQPCHDTRAEEIVWVEDAALIAPLDQMSLPEPPSAVPKELQTAPKPRLLFRYDAAKNRAAWSRLEDPLPQSKRGQDAMRPYALEVTLVGQFDTMPPLSANAHGFGHLGQYSHELVLMDVVEAKPLTVRMVTEPK